MGHLDSHLPAGGLALPRVAPPTANAGSSAHGLSAQGTMGWTHTRKRKERGRKNQSGVPPGNQRLIVGSRERAKHLGPRDGEGVGLTVNTERWVHSLCIGDTAIHRWGCQAGVGSDNECGRRRCKRHSTRAPHHPCTHGSTPYDHLLPPSPLLPLPPLHILLPPPWPPTVPPPSPGRPRTDTDTETERQEKETGVRLEEEVKMENWWEQRNRTY